MQNKLNTKVGTAKRTALNTKRIQFQYTANNSWLFVLIICGKYSDLMPHAADSRPQTNFPPSRPQAVT